MRIRYARAVFILLGCRFSHHGSPWRAALYSVCAVFRGYTGAGTPASAAYPDCLCGGLRVAVRPARSRLPLGEWDTVYADHAHRAFYVVCAPPYYGGCLCRDGRPLPGCRRAVCPGCLAAPTARPAPLGAAHPTAPSV